MEAKDFETVWLWCKHFALIKNKAQMRASLSFNGKMEKIKTNLSCIVLKSDFQDVFYIFF